MATTVVKTSEIRDAIAKAFCVSDNWQAQLVEILLIPQVYCLWQGLQSRKYEVSRHGGKQHAGFTRDQNLEIGERGLWHTFAGYTLQYGNSHGSGWNAVRSDHYGHSPSTTWDGIRRETLHSFIESLRTAYYAIQNSELPHGSIMDNLAKYNLEVEDDL